MTHVISGRPDPSEYGQAYAGYISLIPETDILDVLRTQADEFRELISSIPEERAGFRYAQEKWSIREVLGHITDAERVFAFRAMTFARKDSVALPGFNEQAYVGNAIFNRYALMELLPEFEALRKASVLLLEHINEEAWSNGGTSNNNKVTVRALAYIMAGHVRHHINILQERYLPLAV